MLPIESCAEIMENAQPLPLWYKLISIQWWMGGVQSHSELSVRLCEHFPGEWEKQGSVSPFSCNHIHCELFGWGETCLDLNNVSLTHETWLSDTKAEKNKKQKKNKDWALINVRTYSNYCKYVQRQFSAVLFEQFSLYILSSHTCMQGDICPIKTIHFNRGFFDHIKTTHN